MALRTGVLMVSPLGFCPLGVEDAPDRLPGLSPPGAARTSPARDAGGTQGARITSKLADGDQRAHFDPGRRPGPPGNSAADSLGVIADEAKVSLPKSY
jgi:hypothetical protein